MDEQYDGGAREASPSERLLAQFDDAIKRLTAAVVRVDTKMGPALRDAHPQAGPDGTVKIVAEFQSELMSGVHSRIRQIDTMTDRLTDLAARVEL